MRLKIITLLVLCTKFFAATAQDVNDTLHVNFLPYKGKMIMVNEFHGVDANSEVYEHIIRKMAEQFQPGDTLNLILESPYSVAWLLNNYLSGKGPLPSFLSGNYVARLKDSHIPIRVFGCDFEYNKGGSRAIAYRLFLQNISAQLAAAQVPVTMLNQFIASLYKDSTWQRLKGVDKLVAFYKGQLQIARNADVQLTIKQLLFVLNARQAFHPGRDGNIYERLVAAGDSSLINFNGKYNLLIHGAVHTNPSYAGNLYSSLQNKTNSPFYNNCYYIAQAYIGCTGTSGIFSKPGEHYTMSTNLLTDDLRNTDPITAHIRDGYTTHLAPNTITTIRTIDQTLLTPYQSRILYWYLQYQTH